MDSARSGFFGISQARLTAYGAVLLLCGIIGWNAYFGQTQTVSNAQFTQTDHTMDAAALLALSSSTGENTSKDVTPLGASIFAQAVVEYDKAVQSSSSTDAGITAVQSFGASILPTVDYRTYAASDIQTVSDTSKDRVLSYRADLRVALEPLLENKEYELDIFGKYVDTKDPQYLNDLNIVSQNYRLAITNLEKVVAPADAASYQAAILTSLDKFASTLDALSNNATDPFASSALLRSFMDAQDGVVASFDLISKYAARKIL